MRIATFVFFLAVCQSGCSSTLRRETGFVPRQVTRTYAQRLAASPQRIMPLLTPEGERGWADGWDPIVLGAPAPGVGTVFVTRHAEQPAALWLQVTHDSARGYVRYVYLIPGLYTVDLDIQLHPLTANRSRALVRYTYTGLTERGNAEVVAMTEDRYRDFMQSWEVALNYFLTTGERYSPHRH
jgi:hypothetical protein